MQAVFPANSRISTRFDILDVNSLNLLVVAVLASLASFLDRQTGGPNGEPRKFSWLRFAAHLSASVLSAIIASHIAVIIGVDSEKVLFAICGVCGWAGKEGVDWMIYAIRMKVLMTVGLTKASDREVHRYDSEDAPKSAKDTYVEMPKSSVIDTTDNPGSLRKKKNL